MKWMRIFVVSLLLVSSFSQAQDSHEWDWKIAPYLWTAGISGDLAIGDINQDVGVSFSQILDDLDIGGSVFAELGKGQHAVHVDYTYLRVKAGPTELPNPPFPPNAELTSKMTTNLFETAYNYRLRGPGGPAIVVGARLIDLEMRMSPANLPAATTGPNWWDYFAGVKTHNEISTNWDFDFYGTIGTGGSDLPWTLQAMFSRRFSNSNRLGLGARVWDIDYTERKGLQDQITVFDVTFYGLIIGYEFN